MTRKFHFDYLRVFAMFSVIAAHVCSSAIGVFKPDSTIENIVYYSIRNVTRYAVPIFFMISGSLLLNPTKERSLKYILKKYVFKYLMVIFIFGWGYAYLEEVFTTRNLGLESITHSFMMMVEGHSWEHMWYMYALVGAMLFLPVLKIVTKYSTKKQLEYFILISLLFISIFPLLSNWTTIEMGIRFPISSIYIIYMVVGYYITTYKSKTKPIVWNVVFVICLIVILVSSGWHMIEDVDIEAIIAYSSPVIVLLSLSLFILFNHWNDAHPNFFCENQVVARISACSFGIYLVHVFWINLFYKVFHINPFAIHFILGFLVMEIIVFIFSYSSVLILKKIPIIKTII